MRITEVWFGTVLCLSCFGKALGELPAEETEGEDPVVSRTIEQSVATADDKFAIFENYTRKENLTQAQQFCDESLHGNLTRIIELKFTENATLPASTGWIGLALSNSTFLWYNNKTALDILQCLPRPNTNEKFCTFYEYMNQNTGALLLSSVGLACSACKNITATFFACVKGISTTPTSTSELITSPIVTKATTGAQTTLAPATLAPTTTTNTLVATATPGAESAATSETQTRTATTQLLTSLSAKETQAAITTTAIAKEQTTTETQTIKTPISIQAQTTSTTTEAQAQAKTTTTTTTTTTIAVQSTTASTEALKTTKLQTTATETKTLTAKAHTTASSTAARLSGEKTLTSTPVKPGLTTTSSTITKTEKGINRLKNVDVNHKDSLKQIWNASKNVMKTIVDSKSNEFVPKAVETIEEKFQEYAAANLRKRRNGTFEEKTEELDIFMTVLTPAGPYKNSSSSLDQVVFPPPPQNNTYNICENCIIIPLGSAFSNRSIFVGILFHKLGNSSNSASKSKPKTASAETKLISKVISAAIIPKLAGKLESNITFTLTHEKQSEAEAFCAFINESSSSNYSTKGCSVTNTDDYRTDCTCDHMTSFAIITKTRPSEPVGDDHRKALSIITYVGLTLSLIGEVLTVGCYVLLIGLNNEQAHLHTNLAFALAMAQIFFLAGMSAAGHQVGCLLLTALIHYFYLATFCWMLVEGFHLYLMVVKVFNENTYLKFYYLFSWVTPLVIVSLALITAAASPIGVHAYVHEDVCWVAYENNYIWFFMVPVLLVFVANLVLLFLVVREMTKMNKTKDGAPSLQFRQSLKACLLLFPILGTTWVFCVLLIIKYSLAFEYIFNILNSLQGFFIFLFYVMRSTEIRTVLKQRKARWATSLDLSHQHPTTFRKTASASGKTQRTSASSVKPILGNWTGSSTKPRITPPSQRNTPSPATTRSSQGSLSLKDTPISRSTPSPTETTRDSLSGFSTPGMLTTSDPPDLFEAPRRPSSKNKIFPAMEMQDAETSA